MSALFAVNVGDHIIHELAYRAGMRGSSEVLEVSQETHENTASGGEFALETWLHFKVDAGEGQEEHYYLPGTLQWNVLQVVYSEMTTPFTYR